MSRGPFGKLDPSSAETQHWHLPGLETRGFPLLPLPGGPPRAQCWGAGRKPSYVWQEGGVSSSQEQTSSGNLDFCC